MKKTKYFPCPYCTRLGIESVTRGECMDMGDDEVGAIMVPIEPDWPCGGCNGEGYIPVGSDKHFSIKIQAVYRLVAKIFGEEFIDGLEEKQNKLLWGPIESALLSIKEEWLKYNNGVKDEPSPTKRDD